MGETRSFTINLGSGSGIFRRLRGKKDSSLSEISSIRQLLSDERVRILHTIKIKKPVSMYHLSKILGRDFKAVREDIKFLERLGFLELETSRKGKREMLKPILTVDRFVVTINI